MPKFFVKSSDVSNGKIYISGDDFIHIKNVLRLRQGDNIIVNDGALNDYKAVIERLEDGKVVASIVDCEANKSEPPIEVTLYQGMPKSDKMDFIIQKCVELGVTKIVPVITERTVVKLGDSKDSRKKTERWRRIALEAAKQSNRGVVPYIYEPISFKEAITLSEDSGLRLIPYEKEKSIKLSNCLNETETKKVSVFIGPEGGYSEEEIKKAEAGGVVSVSLGPRILRTETAGLMVLSILMYTLGDVGQ